MKKYLLFILLISTFFCVNGQRFFFIESSNDASDIIRQGLLKGGQFISKSKINSDCTVKAEAVFREPNKTIIKIILQDSANSKVLLEASEEYSYKIQPVNAKISNRLFLKIVTDRYVKQLITYAETNIINNLMLLLKEKKDKT